MKQGHLGMIPLINHDSSEVAGFGRDNLPRWSFMIIYDHLWSSMIIYYELSNYWLYIPINFHILPLISRSISIYNSHLLIVHIFPLKMVNSD